MVTLLDFGVGLEERLDQVIRRGAGTDAGEVGTNLATGAAEPVFDVVIRQGRIVDGTGNPCPLHG